MVTSFVQVKVNASHALKNTPNGYKGKWAQRESTNPKKCNTIIAVVNSYAGERQMRWHPRLSAISAIGNL
jgi:hypothetical protein